MGKPKSRPVMPIIAKLTKSQTIKDEQGILARLMSDLRKSGDEVEYRARFRLAFPKGLTT